MAFPPRVARGRRAPREYDARASHNSTGWQNFSVCPIAGRQMSARRLREATQTPTQLFRPSGRCRLFLSFVAPEDVMARFRWHADYFDGPEGSHCVRREII